MKVETDEFLKNQVATILASNPSQESIYLLFLLSHKNGVVQSSMQRTWYSALETAEKVLETNQALLKSRAVKRYQEERQFKPLPQVAIHRMKPGKAREAEVDFRVRVEAEKARSMHSLAIAANTLFWVALVFGFPIMVYHFKGRAVAPASPSADKVSLADSRDLLPAMDVASSTVGSTSTVVNFMRNVKKFVGPKDVQDKVLDE